jgi:hypothetical protein
VESVRDSRGYWEVVGAWAREEKATRIDLLFRPTGAIEVVDGWIEVCVLIDEERYVGYVNYTGNIMEIDQEDSSSTNTSESKKP